MKLRWPPGGCRIRARTDPFGQSRNGVPRCLAPWSAAGCWRRGARRCSRRPKRPRKPSGQPSLKVALGCCTVASREDNRGAARKPPALRVRFPSGVKRTTGQRSGLNERRVYKRLKHARDCCGNLCSHLCSHLLCSHLLWAAGQWRLLAQCWEGNIGAVSREPCVRI